MYDTLLSPIQIGEIALKNRLAFAPTTLGYSPAEQIEKYRAVAQAGTALIIIGDISVLPSFHQQGHSLTNEAEASKLKIFTDVIHQAGGKVAAQLFCPDYDAVEVAKWFADVKTDRLSATEMRQKMNDGIGQYVTNMSLEKITAIQNAFVSAALLAQKAGFDLLQLHGDHLLGSFSSSLFNQRTDCYGGSPQNNLRFALEVITKIKDVCPLAIEYKLAIRQENPHYGNAGILLEDVPLLVPLLEEAGIDSFHVTIANHGNLEDTIPTVSHAYFQREGCFLYLADAVKAHTRKPVCGVGKLSSPDFINNQLSNGRIDMAAMSRQLIADDQWLAKVTNRKHSEINRCVCCNKRCVDALRNHRKFGCIHEGRQF